MNNPQVVPLLDLCFLVKNRENGLILFGTVIPEEILILILSYVDPVQLLRVGLVCKKWYNATRSFWLWSEIYKRKYRRSPKELPWYLFYCLFSTEYLDRNLLQNRNCREIFSRWRIMEDEENGCRLEQEPNPLLSIVREFRGQTVNIFLPYGTCGRYQNIIFKNSLLLYIVDLYKPHILASEWVKGKFDCGSSYLMTIFLLNGSNKVLTKQCAYYEREAWQNPSWKKISTLFTDYPDGVKTIIFQHEGIDAEFWSGSYGTNQTGAVVKLIFDSIEPKC